ncbi:MAG: hypothetical protein A2086_12610 [Spirochaetes bacterium GWD1_27_9]|nr:MAG: hypothetical protein A2Z98_10840 [Spirochaetes bacterium GWB1_27_13]OHD44300.1 MAG: hypothetical protein A2086_12610 [Spirochaetes bacterium GWD1_27_9]
MNLIIDKTIGLIPTKSNFVDSVAINKDYAVIFEINDATAYFYALDISNGKQKILDVLYIYNTTAILEPKKVSAIKIDWSDNYRYAILFINDDPHAIFDFEAKRGYNQVEYPSGISETGWSNKNKEWNSLIKKILNE